jgi:Urocanase Rossmann-like domain
MQLKDLQHETMRVYKTLIGLREDWGGKLVLCCGPDCAQSGIPSAVSIAGGTTLAIDSDAAAMKAAMRSGYLDFVVNMLDEALRTLKNEVRQERPLSVGLIANVNATLAEMVERGVQPDLQLIHCSTDMNEMMTNTHAGVLRARGMLWWEVPTAADNIDGRPVHELLILDRKRHYEHFFPASDAAALREIDTALLRALPAEDVVRRRWLERVPKYLREARSGGRWIWLSDSEPESLSGAGLSPAPQP